MWDDNRMVTFSYMDWSIPSICLTHEVAILHYASHLLGIVGHGREMFKPLRVDLMSFQS